MKNKYTTEQQAEALRFFEEGFTGPEISQVLNIKLGTLYRWKSEVLRRNLPDATSKSFDGVFDLDEGLRRQEKTYEDLRRRVEVLENYINRLEKSKRKESDWEEPVKGWKPPQR